MLSIVPHPEMLAAYAQTIAKVMTPLVLVGTLVFALRAPRPGKDEEG